MSKYYYPEERIAIVGIGGVFADAEDIQAFWQNILSKKVSIKALPDDVVNSKIYYRPEVQKQVRKQDKTYTIMGSVVNPEPILNVSKKFKIPPAVAEYMDLNQHAAIYCVDQALQAMRGKPLAKERTAVILSTGNPATFHEKAVERVFYEAVEDYIRNNPLIQGKLDPEELDQVLQELAAQTLKGNLPLTEDSATGFLPNLVPGRISNVFDFQGPAFTVDAACASSLAAVMASVQGLLRNEFDSVITGGIDFGLDATRLAIFSAVNALSPNGSFPFDTRANGFVMGQGGGVVVMKRLSDALRDQDNIIALIAGYGGGSDGKGKYIAAPNEDGQARVVQQACQMAGYSVDTIELMEAHGTGTAVGDVVEVNALKKAFSGLNASRINYCGLGSAKSNIGHLKAAAGAPGILKATMALYHKILPPTANVQQINPKLQLEGSPFYVLTDKRAWQENSEYPRRANVSAFGFGGADYHIAMEEFRPEFYRKTYVIPGGKDLTRNIPSVDPPKERAEAVLFSGDSLESLNALYQRFANERCDGVQFSPSVFRHNAKISADQRLRLAICASSYDELEEKWLIFEEHLKAKSTEGIEALALKGIYFGQKPAVTSEQMAFLFPGQASQYSNMGRELPQTYPMLQSFYAQVDALWEAKHGYPVTSLIFGDDTEALDKELKNTKNTHPAIFLSSVSYHKLLTESGVKADYLIGHSLGEMTALYAGEMLDLSSALQLIAARGFSFDAISEEQRGKMMSIKAGQKAVEEEIRGFGNRLFIANLNSPEQTVVGGTDEAIDQLEKILSQKKIPHTVLNVSHAFHTPLIADAAEVFYQAIANLPFAAPRVKIMANHLQAFYPTASKALKEMPKVLRDQITSSVRFTESVEKLYQHGIRVFVEAGPSTVLTNLVKKILEGKDVKVISVNIKNKDAVEVYNQALAELFALGVGVRMVPSQSNLGIFAPGIAELKVETQTVSTDNCVPAHRENLVYSGVSMGVPGSFKKVFADDNFDLLCEGRNSIEMLNEHDLQNMLDLNITRLIKKEEASTFKRLSSINDVIRLAGKLGELDMLEDYLVDDRTLQQMTTNICAGVAAGYEALKDAGIPLVREWVTTSSGAKIPGRLALPKEMQDDTGIIFASCFTKIEPFVREVSKFIASKFGGQSKVDLISFYETLITKISEPDAKRVLTDWFAQQYSRLDDNMGADGVYEFNNDFMTQFSSLANNRLAQFIGASGPNFQLSAACSSTAYAITVAESLIRTCQARRMIVIGAENPTSKELLPWIGGGFLTSGAATNSANIYEAAVPFDNRRNGMIMGAGAVGIVIEKEAEVEARGMNGICRLLGTHAFNLAGHQTRIDSKKFSIELDRFIARMEKEYQFDRKAIAAKTLYFSHETFTPKKGGCSQTEKAALEAAFGDKFREILVTNTKGMTGHTIGASIEEAVSAKSLQYQKVPPVANYKEPDPELEGLKLSKGGAHAVEYALRMVAGFGGQGNYILMQKIASGDNRVMDSSRYQMWLDKATGHRDTRLGLEGRILIAKGSESNEKTATEVSRDRATAAGAEIRPGISMTSANKPSPMPESSVIDSVLEIFSSITKYPKEMLDLNMEMEADLGIDTVKQATIFSMIADKFQLEQASEIQLSNYPTIGHMVSLIASKTIPYEMGGNQAEVAAVGLAGEFVLMGSGDGEITKEVLNVISEVTKYPIDMLELNMEMEADLGIDTVKQATIFAMIAEKFHFENASDVQLSNYPTIGHMIEFITSKATPSKTEENKTEVAATSLAHEDRCVDQNVQEIEDEVLRVISEVTKYPMDMLELDMEMEADLGIDTVKQATIISTISEKYGMQSGDGPQISSLPTIRNVVELVNRLKAKDNYTKQSATQGAEPSALISSKRIATIPEQTYKSVKDERTPPLTPLTKKEGGVEEAVLAIIAEITKYPTEMLEPEMEMEADLGIDTVKQATIFSILGERFGLGNDSSVSISEYKTIGEVIRFVKSLSAESVRSKEAVTIDINDFQAPDSQDGRDMRMPVFQNDLCYQVPVAVKTEVSSKDFSVKGKNVLVMGNHADSVQKMASFFGKTAKNVETFIFTVPLNLHTVVEQTESISIQSVDILVDCGDLGTAFAAGEIPQEEENRLLWLNSEARFIFFKALQEKFNKKVRMICMVSLDGKFGYAKPSTKVINVYSGALCGFYKGLRKEWQESKVKILDFNISSIDALDKKLAAKVIQEVEAGGEDYEIAYDGKDRWVVRLNDLDHAELQPLDLPQNPHFLITGGANGITAEIALGLAQKLQGKITLIGRTLLPENISELAKLSENELNQKRMEIQNKLKLTGKKVTPVLVQQEYEKLTKAIIAYRFIQEIEQTGSQVRYSSCDVRSLKDLQTVIEGAVHDFGPIHGIIHGAGVEKSHMLMDKNLNEFEEVFTVKAEGICNLLRLVDKVQLKVLIGFSSISGRFGNEAQLDYCAANSFLSSYIRGIKAEYPQLHSLSIAWSGWSGLGMAWRNDFVKNNSEAMGVNLIEPARGVQAFVNVLTQASNHQEVVISKGLKGFVNPQFLTSEVRETPLIDWVTRKEGKVEKAYKNVSVKTDPIFDHHRLGTTPLVPAVGMMEMCAEYHRLLYGRSESYCFRDLSILNPIKLFHDMSQEVFIEGHKGFESGNLEVSLNSYFNPKIGDAKRIMHCRLMVNDKPGHYQGMLKYTSMLQEQFMGIPYRDADTNPKWRFNNNINLGSLFIDEYGYNNNMLQYNPNGLVYSYTLSREQVENKQYQLENLLVNPCLMDTLFQAAAIHSLTQHDRIHLPMRAEEIGVIRVPRQIEDLKIIARLTRYENECGTYDLIMIDAQGKICYYAKNVMVQRINL